MILTREEILKEIRAGRLKIEPFSELNLGPASYDVTLDETIRVFKRDIVEVDTMHIVTNPNKIFEITESVRVKDYYPLKPGELVLGITKEKITLPEDICGFIIGRSRFARIGLMVHVSASFIQPGSSNKQVFEIYNASRHVIKLRPNMKIAQIIFCRCTGKAKYSGIWQNQTFL